MFFSSSKPGPPLLASAPVTREQLRIQGFMKEGGGGGLRDRMSPCGGRGQWACYTRGFQILTLFRPGGGADSVRGDCGR